MFISYIHVVTVLTFPTRCGLQCGNYRWIDLVHISIFITIQNFLLIYHGETVAASPFFTKLTSLHRPDNQSLRCARLPLILFSSDLLKVGPLLNLLH